tara:strand:- start:3746 stop:3853 length:108 start_codon:yes stop_codon:yes gene_type:complete
MPITAEIDEVKKAEKIKIKISLFAIASIFLNLYFF